MYFIGWWCCNIYYPGFNIIFINKYVTNLLVVHNIISFYRRTCCSVRLYEWSLSALWSEQNIAIEIEGWNWNTMIVFMPRSLTITLGYSSNTKFTPSLGSLYICKSWNGNKYCRDYGVKQKRIKNDVAPFIELVMVRKPVALLCEWRRLHKSFLWVISQSYFFIHAHTIIETSALITVVASNNPELHYSGSSTI